MKGHDCEKVHLVKGYGIQVKRQKFPRMKRCNEIYKQKFELEEKCLRNPNLCSTSRRWRPKKENQ